MGGASGQRRFGGLLRRRSFRLLWTGETISQLGNAMALVGVPLVAVTVLHASTFAVGVLAAAAWLPWLVIGLPAGAWVDRWPARRVMIVCDVISAALYASVPIAAWAGVLTTGLLVAVQLAGGAASVLFMTAYQVYLPSIVAPAELIEGNTKMQGSASAAAFAGPSLAGLVAQLLGAVTAPSRTHSAGRTPSQVPRLPPSSAPSGLVPKIRNRMVAVTRPHIPGGE